MGKTFRREYIEIPEDYWVCSENVDYIIKEDNAKVIKRD